MSYVFWDEGGMALFSTESGSIGLMSYLAECREKHQDEFVTIRFLFLFNSNQTTVSSSLDLNFLQH